MSVRNCVLTLLLVAWASGRAAAQEADVGVTLPVTITGGALYTHRLNAEDRSASPVGEAFHTALYPSVKVGPHWFGYSSIHVRSTPFFYHDAYEANREMKLQVVQAFVGYTRTYKKRSLLVKAGQC